MYNHAPTCACIFVMFFQRELARQTVDIINGFSKTLEADGYPRLRAALCIGGTNVKDQLDIIRQYVCALSSCTMSEFEIFYKLSFNFV